MNDKLKLEGLIKLINEFDKINKAHLKADPESEFSKGQALIIELLKQHL